jgi:hypothetical protein
MVRPTAGDLDMVTGAFSYTEAGIAPVLLSEGRRIRTLTNHASRSGADPRVEIHPLLFDDPDALARSLEGADCFYNTYWVRFARRETSFAGAVERSSLLFQAAQRAGVRRIVHVSVTNPDLDSPFPYFRGKALVEQALAEIASSWAIVRPTIIFGPGDILMNNVAWLLRHFPVFAIPGGWDVPSPTRSRRQCRRSERPPRPDRRFRHGRRCRAGHVQVRGACSLDPRRSWKPEPDRSRGSSTCSIRRVGDRTRCT